MPGIWSLLRGKSRAIPPAPPANNFHFNTLRHGENALGLTSPAEGGPSSVTCRRDAPQGQRVLLCLPETDRWVGWLMAPDAAPLTIEGAVLTGSAIPVRLKRPSSRDLAILVHPLDSSLWFAPRGATSTPERTTGFAAGTPAGQAVLQLDPLPIASAGAGLIAAASRLADLIDPPCGFATILSAMRAGTLRPDLVESLLALLPIDELAALATHLLTHQEDVRMLRSALPADRWLGERLDSLMQWRANRDRAAPPDRKVAASQVDDLFGNKAALSLNPTVGLSLVALGRRATPPRRLACVLGSARNEGPYLLEWIAHHRAIGFDHIFLYSNDNTDGSNELLQLLARAGRITWIDQEIEANVLPQFRAYGHALGVLPDILDYQWTLAVDLDEFFCFDTKKFDNARDFVLWQDHAGADAVASPWLLFVARPGDVYTDAPSIDRFPFREQTVNHHIKTLFRTNRFWNANCHHPNAILRQNFTFFAETGLPHAHKSPENSPALSQNPQAKHAFVAHYIFRSAPEALAKIARGRGGNARSAGPQTFEHMVKPFVALSERLPAIKDTRPLACAAGLGAALADLRAIPGVLDCEEDIKRRFVSRLADLTDQLLQRGPTPGEIEECAIFRRYLRQPDSELRLPEPAALSAA
jgi:hypothetical protein